MNKLKIAGIDGARRDDSSSRQLLYAAKPFFEAAGGEFAIFDQSKDILPLYDDRDDTGAQASVQKLLDSIRTADAVVFCSPEYHGSMSGAMKNALDWLTLLGQDGRLKGKAIGFMGGGGALGNSGAVIQMMMAVRALHGIVMPEIIVSVPEIWDAFTESGELKSASIQKRIRTFADRMMVYGSILKANRSSFSSQAA